MPLNKTNQQDMRLPIDRKMLLSIREAAEAHCRRSPGSEIHQSQREIQERARIGTEAVLRSQPAAQ